MSLRSNSVCYAFGPFVLEPEERRLLRNREPVDLPPKALDILTMLLERNGRLVRKDDLLELVWPNTFVTEGSLTTNVSRLRAAVGESARDPTYIETVPGSGYRFMGDVRILNGSEYDAVESDTSPQPLHERGKRKRGVVWLVLGGFVGAIIATLALLAWSPTTTSRTGAILPVRTAASQTSVNTELARVAYERGRAQWWRRRGLGRAKQQFRLALYYDPSFSPAYVGLAAAHAFSYGTAREIEPLLARAVDLDPRASSIYATRGFVRMMHHWDWDGAEEDLTLALDLDPADVSALQWLATLRMIQDRPTEADELLRRALMVAPPEALPSLHADRAQALYYSGEMEAAVAANREARRIDPGFWMNNVFEETALMMSDRRLEAADLIAKRLRPQQAAPVRQAARTGTTAFIRHLIDLRNPGETLTQPYLLARHWAALGEDEEAMRHLARAVDVHDFLAPFFNADPLFERLRSKPQFRTLMAEMGLVHPPA